MHWYGAHVKAVSPRRAFSAAATAALAALLLSLGSVAHAQTSAAPQLVVSFTPAGTVTVTLPDGTPVGTTSGTPTSIPAGYYTLVLNGPADCINLPLFELRGPGVNINDDMLGGETDTHVLYAQFQPSSTYSWHLDRSENVVYAFRTTAAVAGAPPQPTAGAGTARPAAQPKPTSQDITGSAIVPFRGTLRAAVSASGKLTLAFNGKPARTLAPGRYAVAAVDRSAAGGVMLEKARHAVSITGAAFVGTRKASVVLSAGKWLVLPRAGKPALTLLVG
jgi:hypothetical protein